VLIWKKKNPVRSHCESNKLGVFTHFPNIERNINWF